MYCTDSAHKRGQCYLPALATQATRETSFACFSVRNLGVIRVDVNSRIMVAQLFVLICHDVQARGALRSLKAWCPRVSFCRSFQPSPNPSKIVRDMPLNRRMCQCASTVNCSIYMCIIRAAPSEALPERLFDYRFFDKLDFQHRFALRWYCLCEEEHVLVACFRPGYVTVKPYEWSVAMTEWWNPARAKRKTTTKSSDGDLDPLADADEAYMGPVADSASDDDSCDEGGGGAAGADLETAEETYDASSNSSLLSRHALPSHHAAMLEANAIIARTIEKCC